ncbi:chromatin modification-related protein EAF7-domain-containing protein [Thamnocephalis sphaerospora]|uniref:Chromatin modification-related protein EAF7-domain-containing protein n=1 Tax=Thamnocephalis sphaerospora TaxID=78915 RepID=A0A4P9XVB5_9FUNG|nr:chromatin modification-related protein EAF7-domain-containing protein [Thamnocephalis sphaerospora]|eukprot:RKP09952.1 chromatin modification-related protein EAF7-domain-containing protein [Thamnocephalis sphaerospora]
MDAHDVEPLSAEISPTTSELPVSATTSVFSEPADAVWTPTMEAVLFRAVTRYKPVGMHKHFRMLAVLREFNRRSKVRRTAAEIWAHLTTMYDLDMLDEMEEDGEQVELGWRDADGDQTIQREFRLPAHEFEDLVPELRKLLRDTDDPEEDSDLMAGAPLPMEDREADGDEMVDEADTTSMLGLEEEEHREAEEAEAAEEAEKVEEEEEEEERDVGDEGDDDLTEPGTPTATSGRKRSRRATMDAQPPRTPTTARGAPSSGNRGRARSSTRAGRKR